MMFIDKKKAKKDKNGIWISKLHLSKEVKVSQQAWKEIYSFKDRVFTKDREIFNKTKLNDHISYINNAFSFDSKTTYLEIGCGPSYIGEYLMKKHNCHFIGVDFNYPFLVILKEYLEKKGYENFTLIYADINDMPISPNSIDFVYGGGVIEHSKYTKRILERIFKILKPGGVSFNTVPAFNMWWFLRCFYSIPEIQPMRRIFEYFHEKIMNNKQLLKHYGYELSFTENRLETLHKQAQFQNIHTGSFAFHPNVSNNLLKTLGNIYFNMSKNTFFSPMYFVYGRK